LAVEAAVMAESGADSIAEEISADDIVS